MSLLVFLIVGVVAGWLAGMLVKGGGFGLLGDLVVGVIGAFVGEVTDRISHDDARQVAQDWLFASGIGAS